jgi:acetolactate synthase-1/2/3 large subunit
MKEADLVVTLGRRLDFQLAYGSPAVFSHDAKFLRIGRTADELSDNRRGAVECKANVEQALLALLSEDIAPVSPDDAWRGQLIAANADRVDKLANKLARASSGSDGRMHPYSLISAVNNAIDERTVTVVDGGDILSFARVGLRVTNDYLDPGALGCIGVGVPFAIAAALTRPAQKVVAMIGDGSFGLTAMDVHTAVRHAARAVFVIANNEAWNIDRHDQLRNYRNVVGVDLAGCRYDQLARSMGAHGERIADAAALPAALARAFENAPAVVEVMVSREPTSPDFESGLAEVCSRQALRTWHEAEEARLKNALFPT